jgi:hypothetical protein
MPATKCASPSKLADATFLITLRATVTTAYDPPKQNAPPAVCRNALPAAKAAKLV